jgi:branched-chain amino acid transport system ATP-binding protein
MSARNTAVTETPALDVVDISKGFAGLRAVDGVSLSLAYGATLGIIGPNGAGKSTFINLATGLMRPDSGRVLLDGQDVTRQSLARRARRGLLRTFQHTRTFATMTVAEAIRVAMEAPRARARKEPASIESCIEDFGLGEYAGSIANDLPYGAQKVLNLALIAQSDPKVLLLDEPFAGVDEEDIGRLTTVIGRFRTQGVAIGIVEHNMEALLAMVDHVVVLDSGQVIFRGSARDMLADPQVRAAYLGAGISEVAA